MYKEIGMRIRYRRRKMELTQEMLSQKVGISLSFLGHIERGSRVMSVETLLKLAQALGCTTDQLLGLDNENAPPMTPLEKLSQLLDEASAIAEELQKSACGEQADSTFFDE